jgi:hypothetical protein
MAKKIKINVSLSFTVDLDTWANEYGLEPDQANGDARDYLPHLVREYVESMSLVKNGIVDYRYERED